jgi:MoxR-like ATPase
MKPNACIQNNECGQYCRLLDNLTDQSVEMPCAWPERLEKFDPVMTSQPELAQQTIAELGRVLTTASTIQEAIANPNQEISVAYSAAQQIFNARMDLWKQYANAAKQERPLTDVEVQYYTEKLGDQITNADRKLKEAGVDPKNTTLAQAMHDRETLTTYGLLFDEGMCRTVTQLCVNAVTSRSTLLIGDKGIAKTQAAKFVSGLFSDDGRAKFISGDGSMMKDELIGKMTLSEQNGAPVTTFHRGILTECMEQGIPLVIDEINLIDPAIVMRLQDILLRKPGDVITIQEDDGSSVTVKHGFCVLATANEASVRYQSRAVLDPAFRDRFTILPIQYPDSDTPIIRTDTPPQALTRLAYTYVTSESGVPSSRVLSHDAIWLARLAHASEQLYSKPARDVNGNLPGNSTANIVDEDEPRMSDCITPRKMVELLRGVSEGLNPYGISQGVRGAAYDVIAGMQQRSDRAQMFEIIRLLHDDPRNPFPADELKQRLKV